MAQGQAGRFIGVAHQDDCLVLVTVSQGRRISDARFPATTMSAEAIRIYLDDHDGPVGLAVDGALMELALGWGRDTLATTTLVASATAASADASAERCARYASRAR